ncbi:MAG: CRTAC1 family protein [Acidobacteria bacterium]|nr:CRTAC1 family protein [Acidobacteriota bacterium]
MSGCGATLAGKLAAGLGLSLLLSCGDLPPRQQPAPAEIFRLVEVAESAGVLFRHVSGSPDKRQIYEANSGGVAWLDYDGDGLLDLYLVNGGQRLTATRPPPGEETSGALFRNRGEGGFREVTAAAGLVDWRWGMGAAVADYDNDGDPDLYITHLGANALWRNNGDGTFTDVAHQAGVADPGPGSGAAFGDIDGDGWLDLYVSNYVPVEPDRPLPTSAELCTYRGVPVFCGPKGLSPAPDRLFKSRRDGTFEDVTHTSGVGQVSPRYGFDVIFLDVEDDGDEDIYVANDDSPSLLFINDGSGHFQEEGLMAGVALSEAGMAQAGMGLDAADYDGDGLQDIIKTNFETESFNLYRNTENGLFSGRAFQAGLAGSVASLGFGTVFLDVDRDGILDLFFANGHVYSWLQDEPGPFKYAQPNQVFRGEKTSAGFIFRDVSDLAGSGLRGRKVSRGVAVGDYDGDGDLDLVVNNMDDKPDLLRNDTPPRGEWLAVRTRGTLSNRDGYGARVILVGGGRRQVREVRASRGFLSSSDPAVFFGLGEDPGVVSLEVRWPSGRREQFPVGSVNRRLEVVEGEGTQIP